MTQEATPVGGDGIPADANPADAFNAIAEDMVGPDEQEEEEPAPEAEGDEPEAEDEPEISEEDVEQDDLPAIDPPNSLTAEEKEKFKTLPREAQEFTARRIGELEKGFQTKAQEVAQARTTIRNEALQHIAQVQAETASQLEKYAQQFAVSPPDAALYASDPYAYAKQLQAYQHYTAQSQLAQREAEQAKSVQAQYEAALEQEERQAFQQTLSDAFPEYLDPQRGPQIARDLSAIAAELGYPAELIPQARPHDILAMRKAAEWKAKAEKFDKAMARQMERVRSGKNPPPISKPGVSKGPQENRAARAANAWETVKTAKSRAARDDAAATWMENTGWL